MSMKVTPPGELRHPGGHARDDGGRPAVIMADSGRTLRYGALETRSCQLAHLLRARGLSPGDHAAVLLGNEPAYLEVCWAAQRSGLYLTPVNSHLTASEVGYIITDCGAQALIAGGPAGELLPKLEPVISSVPVRLAVGAPLPGFESYDDAIAPYPGSPLPDETEGCLMFYSSGTTGKPKGVMRPLSGVPFGAGESELSILLQLIYGVSASSVYLSPAPLYHAAPLRWIMAVHRIGGTVVVMERFAAEAALRSIERYKVTHAQFVPTHFVRMLKLPRELRDSCDASSLQRVVHTAAPCPADVKRAILDWWGPITHEYYAGSESNGFCTIGPGEWLARPGSVGRPLVSAVHILDDSGHELGPGQTGIVWFGSGPAFSYHNDPERTARAFNDRGWSTLGDVGHVDEDGYLYLTGRASDMIIRGGVNIHPREIEDILIMHPEVEDVAVIGVPDFELGERVAAVIQPVHSDQAGAELAARLMAFCAERAARFKCPESIRFVTELPRLPTGKVLKRALREDGQREDGERRDGEPGAVITISEHGG
jgi:acyl-CoA synthetase (AMP-forming)/AMP-acid ligase II